MLSILMGMSIILPSVFPVKNSLEPDDISYDAPLITSFDKPTLTSPKQAVTTWPTAVTIHYHNDDGANATRSFYFWFTGVNGQEYNPDTISGDGKDMQISFDFTSAAYSNLYKKQMYMIVKTVETWAGKSDDTLINFEDFPPNNSGLTEIWCIPGEASALELYASEEETQMDKVLLANFTSWKTIEVVSTIAPKSFDVYALTGFYQRQSTGTQINIKDRYSIISGTAPTCVNTTFNSNSAVKFTITLNFIAKINVQYQVSCIFATNPHKDMTKYINFDQLYKDERFATYYNYSGNDLGVTYSSTESTFKVWAPTASRLLLMLYDSGLPSSIEGGSDGYRGYEMIFQPGGIWQVTITGKDLHGTYYNYYVVNSLGKSEVTDPYAKACNVNGDRGMICDFSKTNPNGWDDIPETWDHNENGYDITSPNQLTIYETHIRDLTMDDTWNGTSQRGTYSAFVEKNTTYTDGHMTVTTGFDHLTELGVTAVQLEPVFDYDNDETSENMAYNWGYNPKNYNCVEGGYSTNPYNGATRIKEYKELIEALATNSHHTRVIMDVVFNHVSSAPSSNFNKLMPRYYFRLTENNEYYDGSGCGNEVKTEAPMMRKFIVDSLVWWASEYKVKGFRFDLMGLIDVTTMDEAKQALYAVDPDIYLYGEGWTGDGSGYDYGTGTIYPVHGASGSQNYGTVTAAVYSILFSTDHRCWLGAFNDAGRNALKGENDLSNGWGFISQGSSDVGNKSSTVADMLVGYHTGMGGNPNQCINYASCHDNYALFDQMTYTIAQNETNDYPGIACAAVTAVECTILFSNGAAFIQGGEELFRSKVVTDEDYQAYGGKDTVTINGQHISHNSYNLSDETNSYKWDRKISIGNTSTNDYVQEIEKAIALRSTLKHYDYLDLQTNNPYVSSSPMNVWNYGNGSTCLGMKNGDYFFFLSGCNDEAISFGAYDSDGYNQQAFCSNPKSGGFTHFDVGYIKLGWATCVCLTNSQAR